MTKPNHNAARAARRAQAAEVANQTPRRRRIKKLLEPIIKESEGWSDQTTRAYRSGAYAILRRIVPVDPAVSAFQAVLGAEPTEEQTKADEFPPNYRAFDLDGIDGAVYQLYAATFDVLFQLEGLSGAVSPKDIINSYRIERK